MKYLSVFSGIEAATVAVEQQHLPLTPVGFSEIAPFPSRLLAHHYPTVKNYGDITKYREWDVGPIDVLVGGSPCQAFSIAGLRKGLEDPRGNLALTFLGLADHLRVPWIVWENVPGVLTSSDGRDFGTFLGALSELGYRWAYRVLDASHIGGCVLHGRPPVPQLRRRVFLVAAAPSVRVHPAEVLFERSRRGGHPASVRAPQAQLASDAGDSPRVGRRESDDVVGTICADRNPGAVTGQDPYQNKLVPFRMRGFGDYAEDDQASTCKARDWKDATDLVSDGDWHVRRLVPLEIERLMGFPDGYTDIPHRGRPASDKDRYQALGNSMAVPMVGLVLRRLGKAAERA